MSKKIDITHGVPDWKEKFGIDKPATVTFTNTQTGASFTVHPTEVEMIDLIENTWKED